MQTWKKRDEIRNRLVQYMENVERLHARAHDELAALDTRLEQARQRLETAEERCCQLIGIVVRDQDANKPG
jgi:iron-sulfur cluster repair protein YtfE (RIC family)